MPIRKSLLPALLLTAAVLAACRSAAGMDEMAMQIEPAAESDAAHLHVVDDGAEHLHTDDYVFWRISEGGNVTGSAMPPWKGRLSDEQIWQLVTNVRELARPGG